MVFTGEQTVRDLKVRLEGESVDLEASLAKVKTGLNTVKEGLQDVEDEAEEAGDELTGLSARAGAASGALTGLGASAAGASGGVSGLTGSLSTLQLTAGTLAFTTLPALTAAVGGLGAVAAGLTLGAGGVLGLGAAARGADQLKEDLQIVKENIVDTAAVVGGEFGFGELVGGGIRALDDVFAETLARVAPLLPQFADAMERFGLAAADAIPIVVETLVRLGTEALPLITDALEWLMRNGGDIFDDMMRALREIGPEVIDLLQALGRLTPELLDFSVTITDTLLPAVTFLVDTLRRLLSQFNNLPKPMQRVVGIAIALYPLIGMGGLAGAFSVLNSKILLATGALIAFNEASAAVSGPRLGISGTAQGAGVETKSTTPGETSALELLVGAELGQQKGDILPFVGSGTTSGGDFPLASSGGMAAPGPLRTTPGGTSAAARSQQTVADIMEKIRAAMNETVENTKETATNTSDSATNTGATVSTLKNSPLVGGARSRCDLTQHLLDPLQRVRFPGGAGPGPGDGGPPPHVPGGIGTPHPAVQAAETKPPALRPGPGKGGQITLGGFQGRTNPDAVRDAVKEGVEAADSGDVSITLDGKELVRGTREAESRHFGAEPSIM